MSAYATSSSNPYTTWYHSPPPPPPTNPFLPPSQQCHHQCHHHHQATNIPWTSRPATNPLHRPFGAFTGSKPTPPPHVPTPAERRRQRELAAWLAQQNAFYAMAPGPRYPDNLTPGSQEARRGRQERAVLEAAERYAERGRWGERAALRAAGAWCGAVRGEAMRARREFADSARGALAPALRKWGRGMARGLRAAAGACLLVLAIALGMCVFGFLALGIAEGVLGEEDEGVPGGPVYVLVENYRSWCVV
ncbi:hypothetical protein DL766_007839 [Monosporascus sp. MC13-8B]|uniref:Uncharacterized protein n=1 Tax=Monosporascus cannonballus TaxID=155416 RepID=A0ABY0GYR8_9PEZI|nr:hypothetical protein DL762_007734 [Monosporascus cannonballus]RYO90089.1 hypothetical protein DL763_005456 [Monosporascus cannonballus]RYP21944.1 hypothetical protein DL766_007839 [Monosporascus sp. MC13-8B]